MFTRYDSFVILADTLQWDEATIDFASDKAAWATLHDTENARVLGLITSSDRRVEPGLGASDPSGRGLRRLRAAACGRARARDERPPRFASSTVSRPRSQPRPARASRPTGTFPDLRRTEPCVALFENASRLLPCASPRTRPRV